MGPHLFFFVAPRKRTTCPRWAYAPYGVLAAPSCGNGRGTLHGGPGRTQRCPSRRERASLDRPQRRPRPREGALGQVAVTAHKIFFRVIAGFGRF